MQWQKTTSRSCARVANVSNLLCK